MSPVQRPKHSAPWLYTLPVVSPLLLRAGAYGQVNDQEASSSTARFSLRVYFASPRSNGSTVE